MDNNNIEAMEAKRQLLLDLVTNLQIRIRELDIRIEEELEQMAKYESEHKAKGLAF